MFGSVVAQGQRGITSKINQNHHQGSSYRTRSNLGFQPERSCGLPSLLICDQAGCPFDETGKMPVLRATGRAGLGIARSGLVMTRSMRAERGAREYAILRISTHFLLAPWKPSASMSGLEYVAAAQT